VLEQDRVPERQIGAGDPGNLVERVVPRLDGEQHAQRLVDDDGISGLAGQWLVGGDLGAVLPVPAEDLRRDVDLPAALTDQLAHLERDELREPVRSLRHDLAGPADDPRALRYRHQAPVLEGGVGGIDDRVEGSTVERLELLQNFPRDGIDGGEVRAG
jgi:hypothetical protein